MLLFPFAFLTWRESVVGLVPTEMNYMQVEHNWVSFSKPGYRGYGAGQAIGENLGAIKWRMFDTLWNGERLRTLHCEAYDQATDTSQVEEFTVESTSNRLVEQYEERGIARSTCIFFNDHIENKRTGDNGQTTTLEMVPPNGEDGMDEVQLRFQPLRKEQTGRKYFLVVDGIAGKFRSMSVELAGRFSGNWGPDRYRGNAYRFTCDGKEQTVMLTPYAEIVKVALGGEYSIALMGQPKSARYEDRLKGLPPIVLGSSQ